MLERALRSLLVQTHREWVALVMDDSPEREGQAVVARLADSRIQYWPNPERLGCAGNLDQAFATGGYTTAGFACVLEDDNWYLPDFISANIRALDQSGLSILLRNQRMVWDAPNPVPNNLPATTRGEIFQEGPVPLLMLRASQFFSQGLSNGGLFWRTTARSPLKVGQTVATSALQEYCRTIQVREPVWFAHEPLAVFSVAPQTSREPLANRVLNRGKQSIWRHLLRRHGSALVQEARRMARTSIMEYQLEMALFDALAFQHIYSSAWRREGIRQTAKGLAKILTLPDPLKEFWQKCDEKF